MQLITYNIMLPLYIRIFSVLEKTYDYSLHFRPWIKKIEIHFQYFFI